MTTDPVEQPSQNPEGYPGIGHEEFTKDLEEFAKVVAEALNEPAPDPLA